MKWSNIQKVFQNFQKIISYLARLVLDFQKLFQVMFTEGFYTYMKTKLFENFQLYGTYVVFTSKLAIYQQDIDKLIEDGYGYTIIVRCSVHNYNVHK